MDSLSTKAKTDLPRVIMKRLRDPTLLARAEGPFPRARPERGISRWKRLAGSFIVSALALLSSCANYELSTSALKVDAALAGGLSGISLAMADGASYRVIYDVYNYDRVFRGLRDAIGGLSASKGRVGSLASASTLSLLVSDGSAVVLRYSGNTIEAEGRLYEADRDLGGIERAFRLGMESTALERYNLSFGANKNQNMDLFLPASGEGPFPYVLFIHGGGWTMGEKEDGYGVAALLNSRGYACATMSYRLSCDGAVCEDMIADIDAALCYLKDQGSILGLKTEKTALFGVSAGAHLALLYAYKMTAAPQAIVLVASLAGPTDFSAPAYFDGPQRALLGMIKAMIGVDYDGLGELPEAWKAASPLRYVTASSPFTLLAHGRWDEFVPYVNSTALIKAFADLGANDNCSLITFPNSGHALDADPDKLQEFYADFLNDLDARLGSQD